MLFAYISLQGTLEMKHIFPAAAECECLVCIHHGRSGLDHLISYKAAPSHHQHLQHSRLSRSRPAVLPSNRI